MEERPSSSYVVLKMSWRTLGGCFLIFEDATGNFLIPLSCDVVVSFGDALENKDLTSLN